MSEAMLKLIQAAPPGQLDAVVSDIKMLTEEEHNGFLKEKQFEDAVMENLLDNCYLIAADPETHPGEKSILCRAAYDVETNSFIDPHLKIKFQYNHLKKQVTDLESIENDETSLEVHKQRKVIQLELDHYIKEYYESGIGRVFLNMDESNIYQIVIVGTKTSLANYWNGQWNSNWRVNLETGEIELSLKLFVHFYEDGNVQLCSNSKKGGHVHKFQLGSTLNESASNLIMSIHKYEGQYQMALNDAYQNLNDGTFKALRRQLPVTRTKIEWNKIFTYKWGHEIEETTEQQPNKNKSEE